MLQHAHTSSQKPWLELGRGCLALHTVLVSNRVGSSCLLGTVAPYICLICPIYPAAVSVMLLAYSSLLREKGVFALPISLLTSAVTILFTFIVLLQPERLSFLRILAERPKNSR